MSSDQRGPLTSHTAAAFNAAQAAPRKIRRVVDMARNMRLVARLEAGFTIVEAIVAVTLLAVAIVITIPPIMNSMLSNQRSEELTVAENLAQARIEEIRSLDYADIGNQGFAPDGIVEVNTTETIGNVDYQITTRISYAGSLSGLDVVDQGTGGPGGDGVAGVWDPGVDYKYVEVTVEAPSREHDPVRMETIVAPPSIGAHENIANARVTISRYEPYGPYPQDVPELQIVPTVGVPIRSGSRSSVQVFPGIDPDTWTIELFGADGWSIHPDDITNGNTDLNVLEGALTDGVIRVYRPVELEITAYDDATLADIPASQLQVTLLDLAGLNTTVYPLGQSVLPDLVPGAYDVTVSAAGYFPTTVSALEITGSVSADAILEDVPLTLNPNPSVTVAFWANTQIATGQYTAIYEASVHIVHPGLGIDEMYQTDADGYVYMDLPANTTGFTATGTSPFGHFPDTDLFDTDTGPMTVDLNLGRGSNYRFVVLNMGDADRLRYRKTNGPADPNWRIPEPKPNSSGIVTVVVESGRYRLRAQCDNGSYKSQIDIWTSGSQTTKTWTAPGSCP